MDHTACMFNVLTEFPTFHGVTLYELTNSINSPHFPSIEPRGHDPAYDVQWSSNPSPLAPLAWQWMTVYVPEYLNILVFPYLKTEGYDSGCTTHSYLIRNSFNSSSSSRFAIR